MDAIDYFIATAIVGLMLAFLAPVANVLWTDYNRAKAIFNKARKINK